MCSPRSSSHGAPGLTAAGPSRRPCSRPCPRSRAPRGRWPRSTATTPTARTSSRRAPPGGHARLLGLGQGLRVSSRASGGSTRRRSASCHQADDAGVDLALLPRPRRLAVPRRRPRVPSDPRAAAGVDPRAAADHRAGRGGSRRSSRYPRLARRSLEQTLSAVLEASRAAAGRAAGRLPRGDGADGRARARGVPGARRRATQRWCTCSSR